MRPDNAWSRWISDTYDSAGMAALLGTFDAQLTMNSAADSARMQLYAHGLYGTDQIVGVDDTGLDWDNVYFRDPGQSIYYDDDGDTICESPNLSHRKVIAYNPYIDSFDLDYTGHGTHTSGSVLADSLGSGLPSMTTFSRAMGMAPAAKLVFFDLESSGGAFLTPIDLRTIYIWAYNGGARITSSSWGVGAGGSSSYTSRSQQLDQIAWDHKELLMFRSAGNENNDGDSINSPATAKNIVTVGASESGFGSGSTIWQTPGTSARNELIDVAEFSSHGPTLEGQFKPELMAPGGWYIWSANSDGNLSSNNNGITYMGGTSMACPTAAGYAALVRQYFTEGWYPNGFITSGDEMTPSAALLKAMMISSTRNSPGRYSTNTINNSGIKNVPSYGQGWGRITLSDAIYFNGDVRDLEVYDETTGFSSTGDYDEYTIITGPSASEPFKVVLTYTDYPAGIAPASVVVNDLNLTVIEGANTYLGNVFGSNGYSATGGTADNTSVTELVWLQPTPNAVFTIRVDAQDINFASQPYALVITGDINKSSASGIYYRNKTVYDTLTSGTVISDNELNNGETADVLLYVYNNTGFGYSPVTGYVTSMSSYCTLIDSLMDFGNVNDADSSSALFRISVDNTTPDNTFLPMMLVTNYGATYDTSYFNMKVNGTSVVSLDRDSLVFDMTGTKKTGETIIITETPEPRILIKNAVIEAEKSELINLSEDNYKGVDYDTLDYDNGNFDSHWYGAEYWAVGFTPSKPCSIKAIWWGRYHDNNETDTIKIYNDSGNNPGTMLYSNPAAVRNNGIDNYYRVTITGPYANSKFWAVFYARSDNTTGTQSFFGGENGSGVESRYFDGANWQSLSSLSSNLLIKAEVKYLITIADSGSFFVLNNDTVSVKDISIDTITVKNNASWIVDIDPLNASVAQADSAGVAVYIDTTGLTPNSTYTDTLLIYTDADFSKAITLSLPVILHTGNPTGITIDKFTKDIAVITGMTLSQPITNNGASIRLSLQNSDHVYISVYDVSGRQIADLHDGMLNKGVYEMNWNGKDRTGDNVAGGMYFIKASVGEKQFIGKILIVK